MQLVQYSRSTVLVCRSQMNQFVGVNSHYPYKVLEDGLALVSNHELTASVRVEPHHMHPYSPRLLLGGPYPVALNTS